MIRFLPTFLFLSLICWSSCGNDSSDQTNRQALRYELGDRPRSADGELRLDPLSRRASNNNAMIRNIRYTQGDFDFDIGNYTLGQETAGSSGVPCAQDALGQHIRMLIDDQPAVPYYNAQFRHELTDGEHYMVTFLTNSYGESVKARNATRVAKIVAKDNSFTSMENIEQPMLFLNMTAGPIPQADPGEGILLDFFLINAALGADYQIKTILDGSQIIINNWQPYIMRDLAVGKHQLEMTLVDRSGVAIDTPYNPVSRAFTIVE